MKFRIYRYDPGQDAKPRMQDYDVALDPHDRMLLDALIRLKAQDDTLSFRRSCREGVCGSDAMNINGKNGLACITNLQELKEPVELRPLPGLPVIRDLIVDMSQFFKQYHSIKPYLVNDTPPPEKERLQSPAEREELDGLYECILCACCSTACPSFWWNPDKFVGPAGLLAAYRFIADSRDQATERAPRQSRGPVPAVPLPHDHELRRRLSEGPQSDACDRQDPGDHGQARGLSGCERHDGCDATDAEPPSLALPARHAGERSGADPLPRCAWNGDQRAPRSPRSNALLELSDNELWDLLSGRQEPADAAVAPLLEQLESHLRQAWAARNWQQAAARSRLLPGAS